MPTPQVPDIGLRDVDAAVDALAARIPDELAPLARLAYNYRWAWTPDGNEIFSDLSPRRWRLVHRNPVRLLVEASRRRLEDRATDQAYLERVHRVTELVEEDLARPMSDEVDGTISFLCAEFGVHSSLPIYSGGLGVLAGDILKEASDRALPMVGVGLLYENGYFHQRVDVSGWQHEYWIQTDPELLPTVRIRRDDGKPLAITVPVFDRTMEVHLWRVSVGRVPLILLDGSVEGNERVDEWITSRLYEGNRDIRLAQYVLLGLGAIRALRAVGVDPGIIHLNEGHPALAALEVAAERVEAGEDFASALEHARRRLVVTTHTPVAAGNETYAPERFLHALPPIHKRLGVGEDAVLGLAKVNPQDANERPGMTPLALRLARTANAVSARHGEVAREMWQPLFPGPVDAVPITHVTNGVHLPTWMSTPMRALLDRYLPEGWAQRASDPETWRPVEGIPNAELWEVRQESRAALVRYVRGRSITDRLRRGEDLGYVEAAAKTLEDDVLTIGFARRIAAYKRLYLLTYDAERALRLLTGDDKLQFLFAGKAHPLDDGAKGILKSLFGLKGAPQVGERVAFLEDYDMAIGYHMVAGSDVWVNVPRPPLEASGTSGMKVVLNGGLNLSVLDGWWAEGYDGTNGWAIDGSVDHDHGRQDAAHANALYDLLEHEVVPAFHERDADGIPNRWVEMMKSSMMSLSHRFCATRMMDDYVEDIYAKS